ncbi:MAG: hypothetical protein ABIJ82_00190 [Patescibacteria group bacterium]
MHSGTSFPGYFVRLPLFEDYSKAATFLLQQAILKGITPVLMKEDIVQEINSKDIHGDIERDLQGHIEVVKNGALACAENRSSDFLSIIGLKRDDAKYKPYSYSNLLYFWRDWFLVKDINAQLHDVDTDYLFDAMYQTYMAYAYDAIPYDLSNQLVKWICGQIAGAACPITVPSFNTMSPDAIRAVSKLSVWTEFLMLRHKASVKRCNVSQINLLWKRLQQQTKILQGYVKQHWANSGGLIASAFLLQAGEPAAAIPLLFSIASHYKNLVKEEWLQPRWYPTICFHHDPRYENWIIPLEHLNSAVALINVRATIDEKDRTRGFKFR